MKVVLFFCLLWSWPAFADVDFLYALRCPNQPAPTLSFRHEWIKAGFKVSDSGSMDMEKEREFQRPRLAVLNRRFSEKMQEALPENIDWQKGIRFQPEGFGLPSSIDGCGVVPFVMRNRSSNFGDARTFVGSLDDFQALSPLDQWLAKLILNGYDVALLRAFFSSEAEQLSLRVRELLLYKLEWHGVSYLDFEISICPEWWNDSTPKWCHFISLASGGGGRDGEFWRNGWPKSYLAEYGGDHRLSWNPKSPNYSKFRQCAGLVTYSETGAFAGCRQENR
jgi:hypothetical protein